MCSLGASVDDFVERILIVVIPSCFSLVGSVAGSFLESVGINGRLKRVRLLAEMSELAEKNPELTSLKPICLKTSCVK